jgi:hypothetical protein
LSLLLSNSLSWQSRILPFRSITILETDVWEEIYKPYHNVCFDWLQSNK